MPKSLAALAALVVILGISCGGGPTTPTPPDDDDPPFDRRPVIQSFYPIPASRTGGGDVQLIILVNVTTEVSLEPGYGVIFSAPFINGFQIPQTYGISYLVHVSHTTEFTLSATNQYGTVAAKTTVTVN